MICMFNQPVIVFFLPQITYTLVGRIWSISIELAFEHLIIGLGNGTDSVVKSKDCTWMITRNTWEKASRSPVAQVCAKHGDKRMVG